jgi:hypothetical protein
LVVIDIIIANDRAAPIIARRNGRKVRGEPATQLAQQRLGLNSGATSYHLRQLAAAGFIEEDSEWGNARERWWKSRYRSTWFTDKVLVDREPETVLA